MVEGLAGVRGLYPVLARNIDNFGLAVEAVKSMDKPQNMVKVRDSEQELLARLNDILVDLQARDTEFAQTYHDRQQFINRASLAANIAGALASVVVILIFFTRLGRDINRLQDRAVAIVAGYAGEPLANTRHDEMGSLIDAVNRMQTDLRHLEQQKEMSRQQRFHQEKMAAVGSLAAAIGHEVSNPIAAISGIAQYILDETKGQQPEICKVCHDFAAQILKQTERIALIMRQMTTMTALHSPDAELLDLNALIRSTCSFIAFDKRFAGIELAQELDSDIPAVTVVADHITQILMNLLINAADAVDPGGGHGPPRILVTTRVHGDTIHLSVTDNGAGMSPEVLAKAFDESFTTKPAGKGRGIGLFLCKSLVEKSGGRIALTSTPGAGTAADLLLPLYAVSAGAN
jgi:signal transduction histidine kinase